MSRTIVWEKLILKGFGRYRRSVEVTFSPGLNHLVAPNEHGKSTVVAGLMAVLFGLPNINDPSKQGKAMYRNWDGPDRFEGEVLFAVDGDPYRVQRDLHNDRVSLARREGDRWEEMAGGEHRSRARKKNVTYEETLAQLIGIAASDLFGATFCVGQPLPEPDRLHQNIQQLLSGTGTHAGEALEKLESWLEEITRYTGRLGVSGQDKRKDRELERMVQEKEQLEQAVLSTAASVDSLHQLQAGIAGLENQKQQLTALLEQKEGLYQDWSRWRHLLDRYHTATQEQYKLRQAQREAARLDLQLSTVTDEIARQYPEFLTAPANLEENLAGLIRTAEEARQLEAEIQQLRETHQQQQQVLQRLQEQLAGPLAGGVGRPHLVRDHQELLQTLRQQEELANRLDDLTRQEDECKRALADVAAWEGLGDKPLTYFQQAARMAGHKYEELQTLLTDLKTQKGELAARYALLQAGPPELLDVCREYHARKAVLEQAAAEAAAANRQARERVIRFQVDEKTIEQQFADLADMPAAAVDILEIKLDLENKKQALEAQPPTRLVADRGKGCQVAGLILLAISVLSMTAGLLPVAMVLLGIGLALGIYGYRAGRKSGIPAHRPELDRLLAELAAVDAQLGALAHRPIQELVADRERLKLREQRRRELAVQAGDLPAECELTLMEEKAGQAGKELAGFNQQVQPIIAALGDPQSVFYEWEKLRENVTSLERRAVEMALREFGVPPSGVDTLNLNDTAGWREVGLLAGMLGEPPATVDAAAKWLAALPASSWQTWQGAADRYRRVKEQLHTCGIQREGLEKPDAGGKSRRQRLDESITILRQAINPFTETTPTAEIEQLAVACTQSEKAMDQLTTESRSRQKSLDSLQTRLNGLRGKQEHLTAQLAAILTPANGDGALAKRRWQQWREKISLKEQLSAGVAGLLKGWNVENLEALDLKAINADNTAVQTMNEWQQLVESRPGLPSPGMAEQREHLDAEYTALGRDLQQMKEQVKALEQAIFEQNKQLHGLQGREIINIAATRDRIAELQAECDRMELETEALALAHHELAAARHLFSTTHRERLAAAASQYFAGITGTPGRQVLLDEEFQVKVAEPKGQPVEVTQLSQGTQDQLQVALRLAIADMVAGDYQLPIIFDDPFLNFDHHRLAELQEVLTSLASHRQMLILSHQPEYQQWGSPVKITGGN